nr:hypothetical protein [Tanacetum cinerariifolium]
MVAILEKSEHNVDFHPIVDFVEAFPLRQYTRREKIAQSSTLPTVTDEPASPDRATIAKSSTLPHDSAPRVTSPAADEGSMQHNIYELTVLCTSLQRQYSKLLAKFQAQEEEIVRLKERVQVLEYREGNTAKQSGDDASIKGRSINEGEAAAERISNDLEEIARVLTSMDAATVLAEGIDVPTGSVFIPTAGHPATIISASSEVGPTASLIVTRRKGKEVMIARDAEVARIHAEEELQEMIDSLDKSNETTAKYLQEYQDFASDLPLEKRIELISDLVEDFIPIGSKEETKRLKRKEWKLYDLSGVHHLTAKDKEIFILVEKDYPLRKGLALVMISYKLQYKFPLPVKVVATARRLEMPLPEVCTAIEEKKKKLPVKDRWQLH